VKKVYIILLVAIFLGFFNLSKVEAANYERLFYFREGPLARESFFAHADYIDIFAPQTYSVDKNGDLSGSVSSDLLFFANGQGIKVMPLLTNGMFSQADGYSLLNSSKKQKNLIKEMIKEAKDKKYIGWQIDFEQMELAYRNKFSEFVERMYKEFQKNNLQLSVAVIAQLSERPEDYPKNLWQRIIGVYDYKRLAENSDFISIMSYDDPNSLGPVTGWAWFQKVINFSLTKIPKEKISLGLGLYYWRWDDALMKRVGIGGYKNLDNLQKDYKIKFGWSDDEQTPFFHFWEKGKSYTGWYENGKSVGQKISLINQNGLRGFSVWALGLELPGVYTVMN